jgi:polar amino acid transport system substrate-binding protein
VIARTLAIACVSLTIGLSSADAQTLRWGGDAEGGAPFVEADPRDPSRLVGFDVEIAELIARKLGRAPQFLQVQFTSLDQSAKRGDFDIGLSGIEDIPARRQSLAASIPYYEFREVLTVRDGDRDRYRSLADLKGKRVATLGGTMAYDLLLDAERTYGITAVSYDDDVHPYSDLALGRVDGVVLDNVLADRSMRRNTGLFTHPDALAIGHYIIITAPENTALRDQVDQILREAMPRRDARDDLQEVERLERRSTEALCALDQRRHRPGAVRRDGIDRRIDGALRAFVVASGADHADPVVRGDGPGGGTRSADCHRTRLRRSALETGVDRLRRSHARHAGAAAVVRDLLRARVGDPFAGVCRRAARSWAELRRLRK